MKIKNKDNLTPLMRQYWDIKSKYADMILMLRLGDFYEIFGDDAIKAAPVLEVALTQRVGLPMCGVPYHAIDAYLKKLITKGIKVAICDQLEDSKDAKNNLVRRGVTRVITPGTVIEDSLLEAKTNNFLMSIYHDEPLSQTAFTSVDISTGDFFLGLCDEKLIDGEITKYNPGEIIVPLKDTTKQNPPTYISNFKSIISPVNDSFFDMALSQKNIKEKFGDKSFDEFNIKQKAEICACGAVLSYLKGTQPNSLDVFFEIKKVNFKDYMSLSPIAVKNLELLTSLFSGKRENSLLDVIDSTISPMGSRLLRQRLLKPLLDKEKISSRLDAVQFFIERPQLRKDIAKELKSVADIERIAARVASQNASPRDLIALKVSLIKVAQIKTILDAAGDFSFEVPQTQDIVDNISKTITDEPPIRLKEGNVIKDGVNSELDELRQIAGDTKTYISNLEAKERKSSGISSLKIGYNSVFGYYIELTKSFISQAPAHYIRKQTLINCERYITDELKTLEEKILSAQEKITRLENNIFAAIRLEIGVYASDLLRLSQMIAELDVFCGFAKNAVEYNYSRPQIDDSRDLSIVDGRHPVIEQTLKAGEFVANSVSFNQDQRIIVLTGPNMSGKSTYLRQTALIVIMAQIGSFIPAKSAVIGIVDNIFTRIGAGDNLAGGESTFMVEMSETATILKQYSDRSLIILDEVGRGTSTYDGMSIAWSILEFLSDKRKTANKGSKILFATHYFELTSLEDKLDGIVNLTVLVKEWNGDAVFLHKIIAGKADKSYGIHVAKIAGLPYDVIEKAYRILELLETQSIENSQPENQGRLDLFPPAIKPQIFSELESLDINSLSPIAAFNLVREWKDKYK
ncbi:MAG: DNA mismatch repair protein MutS [Elusimicrobiota bacterium]|jgi:DNA mismatch repair protein MutS|nr:DNA mismatch repair protein MutS [Elusimicrobiota bacterium]